MSTWLYFAPPIAHPDLVLVEPPQVFTTISVSAKARKLQRCSPEAGLCAAQLHRVQAHSLPTSDTKQTTVYGSITHK